MSISSDYSGVRVNTSRDVNLARLPVNSRIKTMIEVDAFFPEGISAYGYVRGEISLPTGKQTLPVREGSQYTVHMHVHKKIIRATHHKAFV